MIYQVGGPILASKGSPEIFCAGRGNGEAIMIFGMDSMIHWRRVPILGVDELRKLSGGGLDATRKDLFHYAFEDDTPHASPCLEKGDFLHPLK